MPDSTDLAGVVGTWVAVALALVALIGIVTPWILLRESRSERFQAINAVDSQGTGYVSGGFALRNGRKYFQRFTVPMLLDPPRPECPVSVREDSSIDGLGSATGWVNLAAVLEQYAPAIPKGDQLVIFGGASWLPVHRFWMLVVGLMGRYGKRRDRGISISETNAMRLIIESQGLHTDHPRMYYGLTGKLFWAPSPPEVVPLAIFSMDKVYFRIHSSANREALYPDPMDLSLLFWLSVGCLPLNPEDPDASRRRVFDLAPFQPSLQPRRTRLADSDRPQFFQFKERRGLTGQVAHWAESMGVSTSQLWCIEKVDSPPNAREIQQDAFLEHGDWHEAQNNSLISRVDVHCLAAGVLALPVSPKGFLFDTRRDLHAGILLGVVDSFGHFLSWAMERGVIHGDAKAMFSPIRARSAKRFSRRRVQAHYTLDNMIRHREWSISDVARRSIGVLAITSRWFRQFLLLLRMGDVPGDSVPVIDTFSITLDFANNTITVEWYQVDNNFDRPFASAPDGELAAGTSRSAEESSATSTGEPDAAGAVAAAEASRGAADTVAEGSVSQDNGVTQAELAKKDSSEDAGEEYDNEARENGVDEAPEEDDALEDSDTSSGESSGDAGPENTNTLAFDFASVFPYPRLPTETETWTFHEHEADILAAVLQAGNKSAYFYRPLQSVDLISLVQRMSDVVYASSRPERPEVDETDVGDREDSEDSVSSTSGSSFDSERSDDDTEDDAAGYIGPRYVGD